MTTLILRTLGMLFILASLAFQTLLNWFPGLPDSGNVIFFGIGLALYIAGAVVSFKEKKKKNDSDSELV